MLLLAVGTMCLLLSAMSPNSLSALLISYAAMVPLGLGFWCLPFLPPYLSKQAMSSQGNASFLFTTAIALMVLGALSRFFLTKAIANLRHVALKDVLFEFGIGLVETRIMSRIDSTEPRRERSTRPCRTFPENALLWKELHVSGEFLTLSLTFWVLATALIMASFSTHKGFELGLLPILLVGQFCLVVAYRASGGIATERQRHTLDDLLTLPVDRRDILKAKWVGSLLKGWGWTLMYLPILLVPAAADKLNPLSTLFLVLAGLIHAVFFAGLGLFLSVVSSSVLAWQMRMGVVLLISQRAP